MRIPGYNHALLVVTCIFSFFSFALSAPYEGSVWKGTINMIYREDGGAHEKSSNNEAAYENIWSLTNHTRITLNVCGKALEKGYVNSANIAYSHLWQNTTQYHRSVCQPRGEIKKPGWKIADEGFMSATINSVLLGTAVKPALSVSLQPSGGIKYTIAAGLMDAPIAFETGSSESNKYYPCEGTSTSHTTDMVYTPNIRQQDVQAKVSCSQDGRRCRSTVPSNPVIFPLTFSHTDTTTGSEIIGNVRIPLDQLGETALTTLKSQLEEIARLAPPDLRRQMMLEASKIQQGADKKQEDPGPLVKKGATTRTLYVSWYLSRKSPCDDVISQLQQELSMIQAYADPDLVSQARREGWSGEQYDDAAFENGKSNYASGWWKEGSPGSQSGYTGGPSGRNRDKHIDMALNNANCEILGKEEKRKALERDCIPQIVYDSILEHERTHGKQCMGKDSAGEFASKTPDSYRKFEQSAYCVGAKKLLNWVDGKCKESDVKPLRDVYYTYCPK